MDLLLVHVPKFNNFYNPMGYFSLCNLLPMGLLSIADHVDRQGHRVRILHLGSEIESDPSFRLSEFVARYNPNLVGFSLSWHYQLYDVLAQARALKRRFKTLPLLIGGHAVTHFADPLLREHPEIDYVIRGEGEVPTATLLSVIKNEGNLSDVPNLSWWDNEALKHNPIGFVADRAFLDGASFNRFDLMENPRTYLERFNQVLWLRNVPRLNPLLFKPTGNCGYMVPIGRGCPVACSYCSGSRDVIERETGRSHPILRSTDSVIRELREVSRYGLSRLYFSYDPYPNSNYYPRLFRGILSEGLRFNATFESFGLPNDAFLDEFLRAFGDGPSNHIIISPETGDEKLRMKNRGYAFTNDELFGCLDSLQSRGLFFQLCYTLGLPGETRSTIAATGDLWKKVKKRYRNLIGQSATIIHFDPGSPAASDPDKWNVVSSPRTLEDMISMHRDSHRESLTGWSHLPTHHDCPDLAGGSTGSGVRSTDRYLRRIKCLHFCHYFERFHLPYPLNRIACLAIGQLFRVHGKFRGLDRR